MGLYQHVREAWKKPSETLGKLWQERLVQWKAEPATQRLEHPTRIDRARSVGYKAKQGYIVVRQRVLRGGHNRPKIKGGRRSKHSGQGMALRKSYQVIAEERAQREFVNLIVLNSYWAGKDGEYIWYEVVLVDPDHPVIKSDPKINWICAKKHAGRVFHGRTSAGIKSRGMRFKGTGFEHARPSRRADKRRQ